MSLNARYNSHRLSVCFRAVGKPNMMFENEKKWSGVLTRHLGRGAMAMERVSKVFSPRSLPCPNRKMCDPFLFQQHHGIPLFVY